MTEQYNTVKEEYVDSLKEMFTMMGSIPAQISLIGKKENEEKVIIIHIPLTAEILESDRTKINFLNKIFPEVIAEANKICTINYVVWAAEAWVRTVDKETTDEDDLKNWREIPIDKEALVVIFEGKDFKQTQIFDIKRLGKEVNEKGNLVSKIELELDEELSQANSFIDTNSAGIFNNLYKRVEDATNK
jgi:hypothetical protein